MRRKSEAEYLVDEHGCWIWQLSRNSAGYGLKWSRELRRLMLAHRVYYQRAHEFTSENTIWERGGRRKCRTCRTEWRSRYEQRRERGRPPPGGVVG